MKRKIAFWIYLLLIHLALVVGTVKFVSNRIVTVRPWQADAILRDPSYKARRELLQSLPIQAGATIFVGDSITALGEWPALLPGQRVLNFGIPGDNTYGTLVRISDITRHQPSKVLLMVGVNDISGGVGLPVVLGRYRKIIQRIKSESPGTQIVVQSLLPTGRLDYPFLNDRIESFNTQLKDLATSDRGVEFVNLYPAFLGDGKQDAKYTFDGLHPNAAGYAVWVERLRSSP